MAIKRIQIGQELRTLMRQFPAVAMVGARQSGKTTLAREIADSMGAASVFFDLERESDRLKLSDPEAVFASHQNKCVIIDEVQTMPSLFSALRPAIDEKRKAGRFLLLGSVSPHIVRGVSETLAGRIAYTELCPINLTEATASGKSLDHLWFRGGYPEAISLRSHTSWNRWAENYFKTFVHRDVNFLMGETLSPSLVGNMWQMLAGINGNILNNEMLARSLGISRITVNKYLDFLEGSFIIHRMQPWFINTSKRIVKSPKLYFRDTGVLHMLNRLSSPSELRHHIVAGGSWEGFVVEQVRQLKHRSLSAYYYRTHHGAETDIVLVKGTRPVACVEVKLASAPSVSRGWHQVIADLGTKWNFVVTPSNDDYPLSKNIRVCSLEVFLKKYLPGIR